MKSIFLQDSSFIKKHNPILFQIVIGVICGLLNTVCSYLNRFSLPLYLDTVFTIVASFFGTLSGVISAALFHFINFMIPQSKSLFFFIFCSLTIVLIIRLYVKVYMKNRERVTYLNLLVLYFIIAIFIALEGAIIYACVYRIFAFEELTNAKYLTLMLLRQNIPLLAAAFLARLPVSLVDKALSLFGGFWIACGINKFLTRKENNKKQ